MVKHIFSSCFNFGRNCAGKAIVWAVFCCSICLFVCLFLPCAGTASYFACPKQLDQKGTNDAFDPSFARNIATLRFALRARLAIGLILIIVFFSEHPERSDNEGEGHSIRFVRLRRASSEGSTRYRFVINPQCPFSRPNSIRQKILQRQKIHLALYSHPCIFL